MPSLTRADCLEILGLDGKELDALSTPQAQLILITSAYQARQVHFLPENNLPLEHRKEKKSAQRQCPEWLENLRELDAAYSQLVCSLPGGRKTVFLGRILPFAVINEPAQIIPISARKISSIFEKMDSRNIGYFDGEPVYPAKALTYSVSRALVNAQQSLLLWAGIGSYISISSLLVMLIARTSATLKPSQPTPADRPILAINKIANIINDNELAGSVCVSVEHKTAASLRNIDEASEVVVDFVGAYDQHMQLTPLARRFMKAVGTTEVRPSRHPQDKDIKNTARPPDIMSFYSAGAITGVARELFVKDIMQQASDSKILLPAMALKIETNGSRAPSLPKYCMLGSASEANIVVQNRANRIQIRYKF
ncbi:MAG: hypothetical protein ACOYK8_08210 [Alphaproteobacteria bacterium]